MCSVPELVFPSKLHKNDDEDNFLLLPNDLLTDKVSIRGTSYKIGQVMVANWICEDILEVGVIRNFVVRNRKVFFLVHLYESVRNSFNIFDALPMNKVELREQQAFWDFKPLISRGERECFQFVLHHNIHCRFVSAEEL
jgi:hypothetical protein